MAYILTINKTSKKDFNNLGDVVSIQDITPSKKEYELFDIYETSLSSQDEHANRINAIPEIKTLWKDGEDWKEVKQEPHYAVKYDGKEYSHNYGLESNSVIVSKDILAVEAMTMTSLKVE